MPRTIRTLIFDDEAPMLDHLRRLLTNAPTIYLVAKSQKCPNCFPNVRHYNQLFY